MSRIFIAVDETNPKRPVPCIHIQDIPQPLMLSEQELVKLVDEANWALLSIGVAREKEWKNLACKYKGEMK